MITKIFTVLSKEQKSKFLILIFIQFLASFMDAIGIISILPFLMLIINPAELSNGNFLSEIYFIFNQRFLFDVNDFLVFIGILSACLILSSTILRAYTQYNLNKYIENNRISLSTRLLTVYLKADYSHYYSNGPSDVSKTIISEVDYFIDKVFRPLVLAFAQAIFLIILSLIVLFISPLAALLAIGIFITLYIIIFLLLERIIEDSGRSLSDSNEKRHKHIFDSINLIKIIKIHNQEGFFINKYDAVAKISANSLARFMTASQTSAFIVEGFIFTVLIIAVLILIIINGGIDAPIIQQLVPFFALFTYAVIRIKPAMQSIYIGLSSLKYGQTIIDNLIRVTNDFDKNKAYSNKSINNSQIKFDKTIKLQNVDFKYDKKTRYQLKNVNLDINKNDRIGIIGESGTGKSTLLDVIMGLVKPYNGRILVDDFELVTENINSWQSKIGYVPQNVPLLNDSLYINLFIDNEYTSGNIEQAKKCLRLADLDNFVTRLETNSDKKIVNEKNISGGQKQRIGIARALIRNPSLLILDEITSSLDEKSEAKVLESIYGLKEKTILIVSHKKENLYGCNKVYELDNGNLKEVF
tara:strand:+ start:825 stop:2573 length:1749 start_codon:yes stop_codon:yes gene_type:complete